MQRIVPLIAVLAALAAHSCRFRNCDQIVNDRCEDITVGSGAVCESSGDCTAPDVCDTATSQCVQCLAAQATACTASTPICGTDHRCRPCAGHTDCALSQACLGDGACAAESDVAYVVPGASDHPPCSRSAPCGHVAAALATGRRYLKLRGTIDEGVTVENGRVVTFLTEPGATLTRSAAGGPVLLVRGDGTELAIEGLSIADAASPGTIGIVMPSGGSPSLTLTRCTISNHPGSGISISSGKLTVTQSVVMRNRGGGIAVSGNGQFEIVNSIFVGNGNPNSAVGAIAIDTGFAMTNQLEFNTIYENLTQDGVGAAIECSAAGVVARNNILFRNGMLSSPSQVGGSCAHVYSLVQPGLLPSGTGNRASDPKFGSAESGDFHLLPGSPAIGAADPASQLSGVTARDFEGTARVSPASIGAYQGQ